MIDAGIGNDLAIKNVDRSVNGSGTAQTFIQAGIGGYGRHWALRFLISGGMGGCHRHP
jgi:hypothetical protein